MNRLIKFRAWMPHDKTLRYNVSATSKPIDDLDEFFALTAKDGLVWMQFTGLLDKNGKEIYEGDVVRCQQGCPHEVVWEEEIGGTFGGGMPGWYLKGLTKNCGEGYAWTKEEEVIGNIYENPELLKS